MNPAQLIPIASITKTMTAAVILQLTEERRLSLQDTIGSWVRARAHVPGSITIRQLLDHSSGLANYTGTPGLREAIATDSLRWFTPEDLLGFVGPTRFPAGTRTEYTNTAFLLLGQIAERATGEPIEQLYRNRLWSRIPSEELYLPGTREAPGPVAWSQVGGRVVDPRGHIALLSIGHGAMGVLATARAVAAWGHQLFGTDRILSPAMQSAMRSLRPAAGNIPGESGAGLGIRSYQYLGRTQFGHSGGSTHGTSLMLFDPSTGITVAVLMNQSGAGASHFQLTPRLLEIASGGR